MKINKKINGREMKRTNRHFFFFKMFYLVSVVPVVDVLVIVSNVVFPSRYFI